jgi:hypothetical protein
MEMVLAWLEIADPDREVATAYLAKELLRESYLAANAFEARRRLTTFYDHCNSSGVPELERLARTIARWETPILRWHHTALTNTATEGTNLIVKNSCPIAADRRGGQGDHEASSRGRPARCPSLEVEPSVEAGGLRVNRVNARSGVDPDAGPRGDDVVPGDGASILLHGCSGLNNVPSPTCRARLRGAICTPGELR